MKKLSLLVVSTLAALSFVGVSASASSTGLVDSDTAIKYVQFEQTASSNNNGGGSSNNNGGGSSNNNGGGSSTGTGTGSTGSGSNTSLPKTGEADQAILGVAGVAGLAALSAFGVAARRKNI